MQIRVRVEHGARGRAKTRKTKQPDNGNGPKRRPIRYQNALVYGLHDIAFAAIAIKLTDDQEPYPPGDYEIDGRSFNISDHNGYLRGNYSGIRLTPAHPDDPIIRVMNEVSQLATNAHHRVRIAPRHSCQTQ